jgi:hypothetical protein
MTEKFIRRDEVIRLSDLDHLRDDGERGFSKERADRAAFMRVARNRNRCVAESAYRRA